MLEPLGCEAQCYRGEAQRPRHHEIVRLQAVHHQRPVVVVDEAHLLGREMLEDVRFLLLCRIHSYAERNVETR